MLTEEEKEWIGQLLDCHHDMPIDDIQHSGLKAELGIVMDRNARDGKEEMAVIEAVYRVATDGMYQEETWDVLEHRYLGDPESEAARILVRMVRKRDSGDSGSRDRHQT